MSDLKELTNDITSSYIFALEEILNKANELVEKIIENEILDEVYGIAEGCFVFNLADPHLAKIIHKITSNFVESTTQLEIFLEHQDIKLEAEKY
jgi:hypothetical protein